MKEMLTLEFDGGSRGNPGPAGIGVVVRAADGTPLVTLGRYIGKATNNVAEYRALITAMEEAKKLGATKIKIRGDSELVVRQMTGVYRVKHPDLIPLHRQVVAANRRGHGLGVRRAQTEGDAPVGGDFRRLHGAGASAASATGCRCRASGRCRRSLRCRLLPRVK